MADMNHDGISDVALLDASRVIILLGDGRGGFSAPIDYNAGPAPSGLSIADINHDGSPDLLVGNSYGDVLVLLNQGNGTFLPYHKTDQSIALAVADLTGSGSNDVIYANQGLDRVIVTYGNNKTDVLGNRSTGILAPGAVKIADLNGDHVPDLIVANSGGNNVMVYPGLGNGQFGEAANDGHGYFTGTDPVGITVADVNGDGKPDLVVANKGSNDVSILINQTAGSSLAFSSTGATGSSALRLKVGKGPVSTVVGDYNGDGKPDIVVSNSQSNNVMVLPGIGGGFFDTQNPRTISVGNNPGEVLFGSFDNKPGILTVNAGSNDLTLITNFNSSDPIITTIPSGGLDPVTAFEFSSPDGFDDLVVGNNGDGVLALFEGGPAGLSLISTESDPNLPSPTDLAFATLAGGQVQFYAATEGRESAELVAFSLSGETPGQSPAAQPPEVSSPTLIALEESTLALVATFLVLTVESTEDGRTLDGAETEAGPSVAVSSAASLSVGQSLSRGVDGLREDEGEGADDNADGVFKPASPIASAWERFMLGLDEAFKRFRREHKSSMSGEKVHQDGNRQTETQPAERSPATDSPTTLKSAPEPLPDRVSDEPTRSGQRAHPPDAVDAVIESIWAEDADKPHTTRAVPSTNVRNRRTARVMVPLGVAAMVASCSYLARLPRSRTKRSEDSTHRKRSS